MVGVLLALAEGHDFLLLPGSQSWYYDAFRGARRASGEKDVRMSPRVRSSMCGGSSSSPSGVADYEWVKDDGLKYKSCLITTASVAALQHQVKLVNPEGSCKLAV